jgi:hypothetical protein
MGNGVVYEYLNAIHAAHLKQMSEKKLTKEYSKEIASFWVYPKIGFPNGKAVAGYTDNSSSERKITKFILGVKKFFSNRSGI